MPADRPPCWWYGHYMTERMTLVQARVSATDAKQVDEDITTLGLANRSEAVREGLRLLHRRAAHVALAREYDTFYGGAEAPTSATTALGDQIAVETMTTDASK